MTAGQMRELRRSVLDANLSLPRHGLVTLTWGNASAIDRKAGLVAIKPSGVDYAQLTLEDIVVVDLDGAVIYGRKRPSTDTPTHLRLYQAWPQVGAVVHTHSTWATVWAQAQRAIPVYGTTHADLCRDPIPLTRQLTATEVNAGYELATGLVLIESVGERSPLEVPCALARGHGPFCWGVSPNDAVEKAVTLEQVARMAFFTQQLDPSASSLAEHIIAKHFLRKHGEDAYYGQAAADDQS